ncbi:MAG: oligosaccharide flippase family protein [Desulfurivibrionaceae bacterium]
MKQTIQKLLPSNRFARSVSVLAGGTAAGQAIVVAASPILTRLYSPEDFGVLAVFASLLGILGVIASLRYQLAIPLPESDEEAANVTVLSLLVVLGMALLTAAIAIPFRQPIADALNSPLLAEYIWLLPLGLLLMGVYQVFSYWAIRTRAFSAIARTKLTQSISMVAVQITGYALGPLALLIGRIFGQAAGTTTLGSLALGKRREAFRHMTRSGIREAACRYYNFPLYSSWAGLLNSGGTQLPPILFSMFYGPGAAGHYMLAHRIIALPMTLLGRAIADVFMPDAVEALRESRLRDSVVLVHKNLARIVLPPAAMLFIVAPDLFRIAFGPDWEEAGHMVRWLTPMLFLQFIVSPLSRIFVALERQRLSLALQGNLFLLRLGSLAIAGYLGIALLDAVFWYGIASAVGFFVYVYLIANITDISLLSFIRSWVLCLPWVFIVSFPVLITAFFFPGSAYLYIMFTLALSITILSVYYRFLLLEMNDAE